MAISLAALACGLLAIGIGLFLLFGPDEVRVEADPVEFDNTQLADDATAVVPTAAPWLIGSLQIGGDLPLSPEMAVLTGHTPFGKGGISAWGVRRVASSLPGGQGVANIGSEDPFGGPGLSFAQDVSGAVFASICRPVECASEGPDPATTFTTTFYRSEDGGLTWPEIGSRPGRWYVRGAANGEPIAVSFSGLSPQWILAGSNRVIARPEAAGELDLVSFRGEVAWLHRELPIVISESGSTRYKLDLGQPLTARILDVVAPVSGEMAILWLDPASEKRYLTVHSRDGSRVVTLDAGTAIVRLFGFVPGPAGPGLSLLVGAATEVYPGMCPAGSSGHGMSPAIVEVDESRMSFIRDLLVETPCPAGGTWAFAHWEGGFARVVAPGSCLNLRRVPGTAETPLECIASDALVILSGSTTEAGGTRWTAVRTLGGKSGWVAREFLALPPGPGN